LAIVSIIGIAGIAWLLGPHHLTPAVTVYHCGEPIIIEQCNNQPIPSCRIRNLAYVPLNNINAWAYDKQGTRIASPVEQIDLDGLAPGRTVKTQLIVGMTSEEPGIIVLCSVDPESNLGSRRFGIGAKLID
jgi:hypothetical protein